MMTTKVIANRAANDMFEAMKDPDNLYSKVNIGKMPEDKVNAIAHAIAWLLGLKLAEIGNEGLELQYSTQTDGKSVEIVFYYPWNAAR